MSSLICCFSSTFSQSDTTFSKTKIYQNSSAPDTVIIERIKVQKEKVYIVKRDTVVKTDTLIQVQKERVTDTILVFQPRKARYSLGLGIGSSIDYDHTHYWDVYEQYYQSQKQSTKERLNWNIEILGMVEFPKWYLSLNSGVTQFNDQIIDVSEKNRLTYFHSTLVPYYRVINKKKLSLSLGLGTGGKILLNQNGTYLNPKNVTEKSKNLSYLPTNSFLWVLSARAELKIPLTEKLCIHPQLRYESHPTSITTVEHPVLFWRDVIGLNASMAYKF